MKTDTENKRQHILKIAIEIFAKFGFAKTTLDDIADAVGMKKGSLYYYFDSKEVIFSAAINEVAKHCFNDMKQAAEGEQTARTAILRFSESGLRCAQNATNVIGVSASAQVKLELLPLAEQMLKGFHDEMLNYLSAIIERGINSGEFRKCDAKRLSNAIHSVIDGIEWHTLYMSSAQGKQEVDIEHVVEQSLFLINIILDGIIPAGSPAPASS